MPCSLEKNVCCSIGNTSREMFFYVYPFQDFVNTTCWSEIFYNKRLGHIIQSVCTLGSPSNKTLRPWVSVCVKFNCSCHAVNKVSLIKIIHIVYIVFAEPTALAVFQHAYELYCVYTKETCHRLCVNARYRDTADALLNQDLNEIISNLLDIYM